MAQKDTNTTNPNTNNSSSNGAFDVAISSLNDVLQAQALAALNRMQESTDLSVFNDRQSKLLAHTLGLSPFVAEVLQRRPELVSNLLAEKSPLFVGRNEEQMRELLAPQVEACETEEQLMTVLRKFRNAEQARIIWRDLCNLGADDSTSNSTLDSTLAEASALADVCIQQALFWLHRHLSDKHGVPRDRQGREQEMIVLGMGKLGARELNVSSDIDLIFAYPSSGETDHERKPIDNHQFFSKLGQRLIYVLDARTADGFVYRVDMRLRPYGSSGALALNFASFEDYFYTQGREWERFAMLKARAITGLPEDRDYLIQKIVQPFVYRRYPDYSSFEALREMKRLIKSEVHRKGGEQNIKLGNGGIREIEFIAQATQLIYGGRDPRLQDTGLQSVYATLSEAEYLPADWVEKLLETYRYLRDMEHGIQGFKDQQTQLLPQDESAKAALVSAMQEESWEVMIARMTELRANVTTIFDDFLHEESSSSSKQEESRFHWLQLWLDPEATIEAWQAEFESAGFDDPARCTELLMDLHDLPRFRHMSATARDRFKEFLPRLLDMLGESSASALALERVLKVVQAVLGRTIYLVLLNENAEALRQLCKLCAESQWFADHIAATPVVLDDLLDPKSLYSPPPREALSDELRQSLLRIPEEDLEAQMDCLRNFKQSHMLRVAAAEISDVLPVMKVSDYLTWLAEACVEAAMGIAWRNLVQKHGRPDTASEELECAGFGVLGYGKMGGIELGYSSDLDMVFLYDAQDFGSTDGDKSINNQLFYTRLGQRLVHILATQTTQGSCYEVDMRLRPSGNSGMLVSSLAAFEKYQHHDAWTWEHQALVRARYVAGDSKLGLEFERVRHEVLCKARDVDSLRQEVSDMREKMRLGALDKLKSQEAADRNIKQGRGGLVDIEFITQYLILAYAQRYPELTRWTDNVRLLESLSETVDLTVDCLPLIDAYRTLRSALHRKSLTGLSYPNGLLDFPEEAQLVQTAFAELFKD